MTTDSAVETIIAYQGFAEVDRSGKSTWIAVTAAFKTFQECLEDLELRYTKTRRRNQRFRIVETMTTRTPIAETSSSTPDLCMVGSSLPRRP